MTCVRVVLLAYDMLSKGHVTLRGPLSLLGCDDPKLRTITLRHLGAEEAVEDEEGGVGGRSGWTGAAYLHRCTCSG